MRVPKDTVEQLSFICDACERIIAMLESKMTRADALAKERAESQEEYEDAVIALETAKINLARAEIELAQELNKQ